MQLLINILQGTCIAVSVVYYYYRKVSEFPPKSLISWVYNATLSFFVVCFFVLWMTARIQLGVNLAFNPKAGDYLMTKGLYGLFKHPIYYFGTISLTLYVILLERYEYLLGIVVLILIQIFRASREDAVLKRKYEAEFIAYRQNCLI